MVEIWDIVDSDGVPTGKTTVRGHMHFEKGEYHLVVHIWVIDSGNRLLIQQRAAHKQPMPGEWAATGGSAIAGESSRQAACRELYEELSIAADPVELQLAARRIRKNAVNDIWYLRRDVALETLSLQKEEVSAVRWVSMQQLQNMVQTGEFHNYGSEYFKTIHSLLNA